MKTRSIKGSGAAGVAGTGAGGSARADTGAPWGKFFLALLGLALLYTSYRIYSEASAFTYGLDYFSHEFDVYWMRLLFGQLLLIGALGTGTLVYLWRTRERDFSKIGPREELRRLFVLMALILLFALMFYVTGSIYTEADAAWHQVTIRDTDFTPTHIGLFYFCVPLLVFWGFISFTYAHTRIPLFAKRISLPFAIIVAGAFMIMPNVGFNEWGHTFFYAEELFSAPIHYGFVLLGWSTFAAGGLLLQILGRVAELTKQPVLPQAKLEAAH
ncbi:methane monooxygenase/ammonia monooxygenase subunit C [Rhodoferax sp.]|uniref:methane monooxygenase/ammonia monooxygenase subunit C n=1 Tax=Rhodoferax sp. TaxID=50421 RepID=UPI003BAE8DC3